MSFSWEITKLTKHFFQETKNFWLNRSWTQSIIRLSVTTFDMWIRNLRCLSPEKMQHRTLKTRIKKWFTFTTNLFEIKFGWNISIDGHPFFWSDTNDSHHYRKGLIWTVWTCLHIFLSYRNIGKNVLKHLLRNDWSKTVNEWSHGNRKYIY